jgi:transcriptional regulator with XRE-family HTH domain
MANDVRARFGRKVQKLRNQRKWTQEEMAERLGIDRSYLADVERGNRNVSLVMQETIAQGFKISLAKLFSGV